MDNTTLALVSAFTFVWLGMVLAISFLEAPLKFRAPGITIPLGLGIGRIVFRALNIAEIVLVLAIIVTIAVGTAPVSVMAWSGAAAALLIGQLAVVRPWLNRRSDRVLAGENENAPRSRAHWIYVVLEALKVVSLIVLGISALTA